MTRNDFHSTYKNGDLEDGLWHCFNHINWNATRYVSVNRKVMDHALRRFYKLSWMCNAKRKKYGCFLRPKATFFRANCMSSRLQICSKYGDRTTQCLLVSHVLLISMGFWSTLIHIDPSAMIFSGWSLKIRKCGGKSWSPGLEPSSHSCYLGLIQECAGGWLKTR